jgi:hypothetical protein
MQPSRAPGGAPCRPRQVVSGQSGRERPHPGWGTPGPPRFGGALTHRLRAQFVPPVLARDGVGYRPHRTRASGGRSGVACHARPQPIAIPFLYGESAVHAALPRVGRRVLGRPRLQAARRTGAQVSVAPAKLLSRKGSAEYREALAQVPIVRILADSARDMERLEDFAPNERSWMYRPWP